MNYILMPSLGHIALVKIAITLWNHEDTMTSIPNYSSLLLSIKNGESLWDTDNEETNEWPDIEENVLMKVTQLYLPKRLKEKLFGVVKQIGLELLNWMKCHDRFTDEKSCVLPSNLCWTSLGKIDKKKTVQVLIKDKSVPIYTCYINACIYCLEDDVREIWNSMPKNLKAYFYSEEDVLLNEVNQIVVIWTYYLKGKLPKLTDKISDLLSREMSAYQFGFMYAVRLGNKPATEYFLKKLNPAEREECFRSYDCDDDHSDVLCFLLSQMNEKERITYFSRNEMNTYNVLRCLLEWPLQSFVKETFVTLCELELLPEMEFYVLLEYLMKKISKDITYRDYDYKKLLEQIWLLSPEIYKLYVFHFWAERRSVSLVHDMAKEGNIMLILKDAPIKMRETILFRHKSCIIGPMYEYNWDLIKLLIQECVSSTEMLVKFKNEFTTECKDAFKEDCAIEFNESVLAFERDAWNKFNQVMDELINKKRSLEEGECSQAKKPHTMKVVESNM